MDDNGGIGDGWMQSNGCANQPILEKINKH